MSVGMRGSNNSMKMLLPCCVTLIAVWDNYDGSSMTCIAAFMYVDWEREQEKEREIIKFQSRYLITICSNDIYRELLLNLLQSFAHRWSLSINSLAEYWFDCSSVHFFVERRVPLCILCLEIFSESVLLMYFNTSKMIIEDEEISHANNKMYYL